MINTIQGIVDAAKGGSSGVIAVAAAHDEPVVEAVVAFEITKAFLDKFSGDCMADVKAYYDIYMDRIKNF